MQKVEKIKKETCPRVRKRRNNLTTIDGKKVVGNFARKWISGSTTAKVFENNRNKKEKRSKRKRARMS